MMPGHVFRRGAGRLERTRIFRPVVAAAADVVDGSSNLGRVLRRGAIASDGRRRGCAAFCATVALRSTASSSVVVAGDFDDDDPPARLHGDLWSGNVMWTPAGVVLIDPAAHGGHRETDLAMLALFGCPYLEAVLDGYQEVHPLRAGWRDRIGLHQLYPLLAHVVLFGGGYARQTEAAARGCGGRRPANTQLSIDAPITGRRARPAPARALARTRSSRGCRRGTPACCRR